MPANTSPDITPNSQASAESFICYTTQYASFLRANTNGTYTLLTAAQMLTAIGAQAADADLDTWAGVTPTTVGLNFSRLTNPSASAGFIHANNDIDKTVSLKTPSETAVILRPYLTPPAVVKTATGSTFTASYPTQDFVAFTALASGLFMGNPAGTISEGNRLVFRFKDNATPRALTWDTQFRGGSVALPSTTIASKTHYMDFVYNSTDTTWDLLVHTYM